MRASTVLLPIMCIFQALPIANAHVRHTATLLPIAVRKAIYFELSGNEDRAREAADREEPVTYASFAGITPAQVKDMISNNMRIMDAKEKQLDRDTDRKYHLT